MGTTALLSAARITGLVGTVIAVITVVVRTSDLCRGWRHWRSGRRRR